MKKLFILFYAFLFSFFISIILIKKDEFFLQKNSFGFFKPKNFRFSFHILKPLYGVSLEHLNDCSRMLDGIEEFKPLPGMIKALIEYLHKEDSSWIQETVRLFRRYASKKILGYDETKEILEFLENKIGGKNHLIKVLKSSRAYLFKMHSNTLDSNLKPLFEILENTFGQETITEKLKHSLGLIRLNPHKLKKLIRILKGEIPLSVLNGLEGFEIRLNFKDQDLKDAFKKSIALFDTPSTTFMNKTLISGKFKKGLVQILWPFLEAIVKEDLKNQKGDMLYERHSVNEKTLMILKEILVRAPQGFRAGPFTTEKIIALLKGEEKISFRSNGKNIEFSFNFKDFEIGQLFQKNSMLFLMIDKQKLKELIKIIWPFLEAFVQENFEAQNKVRWSEEDVEEEVIQIIRKMFFRSFKGFISDPESLRKLILVLEGGKKISFQSDKGQKIEFNFKLERSKIGQLFHREPKGSSVKVEKLRELIKILWPFLEALVRENFEAQKKIQWSEKDVEEGVIQILNKMFFQSPQGFSANPLLTRELIEVLRGNKKISFSFNKKTIIPRLNFKDFEIGRFFERNPQKLLLTIEELKTHFEKQWPFSKSPIIKRAFQIQKRTKF